MNDPTTYLTRTATTDWDIEVFYSIYMMNYPNIPYDGLVQMILNDLEKLAKKKSSLADAIKPFLTAFKASVLMTKAAVFTINRISTPGPTTIQANTWNSGDVTFNKGTFSSKCKQSIVGDNDPTSVKKGKKTYTFTPQPTPPVSAHKSRVSDADRTTLASLYCIKINDKHLYGTTKAVVDEYEKNQALNQHLAELRRFMWKDYGKTDNSHGLEDDDGKLIQLIRLVLTDFSANCMKPDYPTKTNERTPFVESIVPIFKYMSSIQHSISFVWCEKGLLIPKTPKLMDGIGMASTDQKERVLIESSGLEDGSHTDEDTLKLLEYTSICLQNEKSLYQQASYITFSKRRLFSVQFVGYKLTLLTTFTGEDNLWTCLWQRTATVPSRWGERMYWIQAFELIVSLMDSLDDQDCVTQQLIAEHNGLITVAREETMRNHYRQHAFAPTLQQVDHH